MHVMHASACMHVFMYANNAMHLEIKGVCRHVKRHVCMACNACMHQYSNKCMHQCMYAHVMHQPAHMYACIITCMLVPLCHNNRDVGMYACKGCKQCMRTHVGIKGILACMWVCMHAGM
jgi:hypothetical protein